MPRCRRSPPASAISNIRPKPRSASPSLSSKADFDAARQALEERLAHVEQAQAADAHGEDIKALQARVGVLEARLKKRAPSATAPRKTAETTKPKVPEPPFDVVGVELRGGERFVSIASRGAVGA
jgi:hypothetical protein